MGPEELAVESVVPHAGNMVLLSRIVCHEEGATTCAVSVDEQDLFSEGPWGVPGWVSLEYMAQCVAVHAGLVARAQGEPPRIGFLLGSRHLELHTPRFRPGQQLEVRAQHVWGKEQGLVAFACSVVDANSRELLAAGRLNCYLPEGSQEDAS
jgi:predicted hotdog family 3-hydroxylacyl-ACP dehydratase